MTKRILIATSKSWFTDSDLSRMSSAYSYRVIGDQHELTLEQIREFNPDYFFVLHWSWKIDSAIIEEFSPILFHTAPLPIGRGGSPIQNLILLGYKESPVWALRMTSKLDSGPLITHRTVSLEGKLVSIFDRIKNMVIEMMSEIISGNFVEIEQSGEGSTFRRLGHEDNKIPADSSLDSIYDRIRMLDSPEYPKSYILHGENCLEFYDAEIIGDELFAKVKITKQKA